MSDILTKTLFNRELLADDDIYDLVYICQCLNLLYYTWTFISMDLAYVIIFIIGIYVT